MTCDDSCTSCDSHRRLQLLIDHGRMARLSWPDAAEQTTKCALMTVTTARHVSDVTAFADYSPSRLIDHGRMARLSWPDAAEQTTKCALMRVTSAGHVTAFAGYSTTG